MNEIMDVRSVTYLVSFFFNKMYNLYINKSYKSCTLRDCSVDDGKFWSGLVDGTFHSFRFHSQLYI